MSEPGGILVVEADVLVRHPLAQYLRECGYQVSEAIDLKEVEALLGSGSVAIDIVLVAGPTGFTLSNWLRAAHPRIEIILAGTVARVTEKAGELCAEGPAAHRPHDHRQVLEQIKRMMTRRGQTASS